MLESFNLGKGNVGLRVGMKGMVFWDCMVRELFLKAGGGAIPSSGKHSRQVKKKGMSEEQESKLRN